MVAIDYQIAYMEVLEILKHIPVNDYRKIPEERLRLFEKYAKKDIIFHYNASQTLDEQNVSEKAKILIAILFRDYWATEEQRNRIVAKQNYDRKKFEEEKRKKYNSNNIFNNKTVDKDSQEYRKKHDYNNLPIEIKNEKFYYKLISFFNKIFHSSNKNRN